MNAYCIEVIGRMKPLYTVQAMSYLELLTHEQQELVKKHLDFVIEVNNDVNLTRIDTLEEGMLLHIEDSLAALPELEEAPAGLYGDLGSGGGYPGIPLAIASGRETYLIDARQKKMVMVQRIIEELGLQDQIHTYAGRAELLAHKMPEAFSVLTARALAKLPVLLELASPLLKKGGQIICYKANVEDAEFDDAQRVGKIVGIKLVADNSFTLDDDINRRILTFQKVAKPRIALPRQEGMAQKKPL